MRRGFMLLTLFALIALAGCGRSSARAPSGAATRSSLWTSEAAQAGQVSVITATPVPPATVTVILPDLVKTPRTVARSASVTPTAPPTSTATETATPSGTPTETPTETPTPEPPQAIITGDLVNVRAGPDVGYRIVGIVAVGDTLDVSGRTDDSLTWYQVCCVNQGKMGWIRGDLLDLTVDAQTIPVVDEVLPLAPAVPTAAPVAPQPQPTPEPAVSSAPPPPPAASALVVNPFTELF